MGSTWGSNSITLIVFLIFSVAYLQEQLKWNHIAGFGLVLAAVFVVNYPW